MKSAKEQKCSSKVQCPYCNGTMRLVRDIDLNGLPNSMVGIKKGGLALLHRS
jgi:hypothetical protein